MVTKFPAILAVTWMVILTGTASATTMRMPPTGGLASRAVQAVARGSVYVRPVISIARSASSVTWNAYRLSVPRSRDPGPYPGFKEAVLGRRR